MLISKDFWMFLEILYFVENLQSKLQQDKTKHFYCISTDVFPQNLQHKGDIFDFQINALLLSLVTI